MAVVCRRMWPYYGGYSGACIRDPTGGDRVGAGVGVAVERMLRRHQVRIGSLVPCVFIIKRCQYQHVDAVGEINQWNNDGNLVGTNATSSAELCMHDMVATVLVSHILYDRILHPG